MLARRTLIKGLTAIGAVGLAERLTACAPAGSNTKKVYRFQTSKRVCKACTNHSHYKVFVSEDVAKQNRAHSGCNCKIVVQKMPRKYWKDISEFEQNGVIDLRAIFG